MQFQVVRNFLISWGMHFDTPEGDSTNIPYPQVYERMRRDIINIPQVKTHQDQALVREFISRTTDTTDGETYLTFYNWQEGEQAWKDYLKEKGVQL